MDRSQVRTSTRLKVIRRFLLPVAVGSAAALLTYCSVAPRHQSSGAAFPGSPQGSAAVLGSARVAEAVLPPEPLSLETLTPVLAMPGYEGALAALEAGEPARALSAFDEALHRTPSAATLAAPVAFVRARLLELIGNSAAALAEYERAASAKWALAADAELGAARALLSNKKAKEALARIQQVDGSALLRRERLLLTADASLLSGNRGAGLTALRSYLEALPPGREGTPVSLRFASVLLSPESGVSSSAEALEALTHARRASREAYGDTELERKAAELVGKALSALPEQERSKHAQEPPEARVDRLKLLLEARRFEEAAALADEVLELLGNARRFDALGCDAQQLRAKAIAGRREWGRAVDLLGEVIRRCSAQQDLHARALFLAGRYASSDKRHAQAVKFYVELEEKHPQSSLSDDARLYAALSYLELGAEARFTELLQSMPEDYPSGDMVVEGVFRLALRRMDKGDWSGAARLLERAIGVLQNNDAARGAELAGRERYFLARAELALGRREQALAGLEQVVQSFPLSYYMLQANTRLAELAPERAERCLAEAQSRAANEPFSIASRPEFATTGFRRVLELLRVGETSSAVRELDELGVSSASAAPELLWGVSLAYARAGAYRLSHELPRRRLTDWLARWPSGPWQRAWELAFPRPFADIVEREAKKNQLDAAFVYAIMREESAFDPAAVSIANAYGLMQLIVPTARHVARGTVLPHDREALKRPAVNIALGSRALAQLTKRFSENPLLAIAGYNAGPGNARKWLDERPSADFDLWVEQIPFLETRRYIKRVLASRATYAFVYDGVPAPTTLTLPLKVKPAQK